MKKIFIITSLALIGLLASCNQSECQSDTTCSPTNCTAPQVDSVTTNTDSIN